MSDPWVVAAYVVVYGTIALYAAWLAYRLRHAERDAVQATDGQMAGAAVRAPEVGEA